MQLLTLGHGTASEVDLAALLRANAVKGAIDVRSVPKSRAHQHVWAERMAHWIPDLAGATYEWRKDLGGFRRARPDSPNIALRHASFRGYADYMQSADFLAALETLMRDAAATRTAIMCSESLWWRCHRRLIADAATLLYSADVLHIMHTGPPRRHVLTEGVRALPSGILQYDVL
ncbi:MAG TPA: DUF488 domain-containing protein [Verrucomicrobiae bacterium]|nr:DUF488 domain-containing protein [Verrucomicrobiae bacterium]HTZ54677.1 DUF488 domain-containing protein [Candidatus Acidoferrum sp.]